MLVEERSGSLRFPRRLTARRQNFCDISRYYANNGWHQATFRVLCDCQLASPMVSAYTRVMSLDPNRLLAVLLAIAVALAPMGGALAANHACEEARAGMTAMEHTQHLGGATVTDSDTAGAGSDHLDSCQSCSEDCCAGSMCSAGACGASVALASASGVQMNSAHDAFQEDFSDSAVTNRQNPPFRPPRV